MRVSCVMCHACVMYNVSCVICNLPSSKCQLRIVSGLLCDKPWCDPVILTTVAVGLSKKWNLNFKKWKMLSINSPASSSTRLLLPASSHPCFRLRTSHWGELLIKPQWQWDSTEARSSWIYETLTMLRTCIYLLKAIWSTPIDSKNVFKTSIHPNPSLARPTLCLHRVIIMQNNDIQYQLLWLHF